MYPHSCLHLLRRKRLHAVSTYLQLLREGLPLFLLTLAAEGEVAPFLVWILRQ